MAIKQRVLDKLSRIEKDLLEASEAESREALADALKLLSETKNQCWQGLPEKHYADYSELYDGLLFAVHQLISGQAANDKGEVLSLGRDLLKILKDKIQEEGGFKKEIVFLPYKSSMWDSLESVWRAAYEDKEHCIPYVIPIPYADLTPEHTVAEWHCEKELFPKDVPVVDWRSVDLEQMHPDVIFIHSPNDEYNRVTSVESQYYSRNLKKCTDKLVYIPYFVMEEFDPEDEVTLEEMQHFVLVPGVLNADEVVVQSKRIREAYIKLLIKYTNKHEKEFWQKRIWGIGSPKIDKAADAKKEMWNLPKNWNEIIGTKKVILYNTGLSGALENTDRYFDKLSSVLNYFRNQNEIALWWRPHPLLEATFRSMRPSFLEQYTHIVAQYIKEGWGIYDDTSDLERAIAWTDGYYGDGSSVAILYALLHKPVLYQNIKLPKTENFYPLMIGSYAVVGKTLFFCSLALSHILFSMNLATWEIKIFDEIPLFSQEKPKWWIWERFRDIVHLNGCLYFTPLYGGQIVKYCLKTKKYEYYPIPESKRARNVIPYSRNHCFGNCITWKDNIYFLPTTYPGILRLNIEIQNFDIIDDWLEGFLGIYADENTRPKVYFAEYDVIVKDNFAYIPFVCANAILRLDMEAGKSTIIELDAGDESHASAKGFRTVGVVEQKFYLLTKNYKVVLVWSPEKGTEACIPVPQRFQREGDYQYIIAASSGKRYIRFLASAAELSFQVDIETGNIAEFSLPISSAGMLWDSKFYRSIQIGNDIAFQCGTTGELIFFDDEGQWIARRIKLCVDADERGKLDEYVKKLVHNLNASGNFSSYENACVNISIISSAMSKIEPMRNKNYFEEETLGGKIYKEMCL